MNRPAAAVFAYATDPTRFNEWQKGVVDKCLTSGRIGFADPPVTAELAHR